MRLRALAKINLGLDVVGKRGKHQALFGAHGLSGHCFYSFHYT